MLSSPSIEYLIDSALPYQLMMEEEYTVMVGITPTGELHILDYLNADSFTKEAMTNNRIPTAFETLHRSQKVHCSLMDPKTAHLQAFLYYLRRLDLPTAFMHAKEGALDPVELLQLWPDLQNEQTSEMAKMQWEQGLQIMTADVIGRNVKNILEFVVTTLKQNSNNPASITSECEEVKRKVDEAYTQLLSFLQQSRHHTACPRVIDVAILKLMLLNAAKQTEEKEEKEEKETHMKEKETEEETEILQRGEEKIITFVSQTSACEESDVEEELRSRAMLIALSQFYLTKNQPAKALTIWRDLQEKGVDRSVFYLLHAESKSNRDDDKDDEEVLKLMLEFTPWMLAIAPEKVFTIFTQAAVSTASIYQSVLALFPAESDYHIRYVDHCVNTLRIPDEKLATEFACHLLQQELSIVEANTVDLTMCLSMKDTPSCLRKHRSVVLTYLKENQNYSNEEVWNAIEATALWFEKVILLNRMKRFDEAISILLNELRSIRYACEFCQEGGQPAWEILLKKLFYEEAEERKEAFQLAGLRVISDYSEEIDPLMVLELLPKEIPTQSLMEYYQKIIPHSTDLLREQRIRIGMLNVKASRNAQRLANLQNTRVVIEPGQKCLLCGGVMMNDSEIGLTQDRAVVHLHCLKEEEMKNIKEMNDLF